MVNVRFIKSGLRFNLAYNVGEIGHLSENQAEELQAAGVVEILKDFNTIPEDFPGRLVLLKNGFTTVDEVKSITDLTEIDGIGKHLDKKIKDYINGL